MMAQPFLTAQKSMGSPATKKKEKKKYRENVKFCKSKTINREDLLGKALASRVPEVESTESIQMLALEDCICNSSTPMVRR